MTKLSFEDYIAIHQLMVVKGADITVNETDTSDFAVEAIWSERARNFRMTITSDIITIESTDEDFEDLTIDDLPAPTIEWVQRIILHHAQA